MKRFCILFILCPLIFASCTYTDRYSNLDRLSSCSVSFICEDGQVLSSCKKGETGRIVFKGTFCFNDDAAYFFRARIVNEDSNSACSFNDGEGTFIYMKLEESDCSSDICVSEHFYEVERSVSVKFTDTGKARIYTDIYTPSGYFYFRDFNVSVE